MKCVKLVGVKKFKNEEVEKQPLQPGQVEIEIAKCGICGSDLHYWDLGQPEGLVLGHEFSGVITNENGCKGFKKGDRVTVIPASPCGKCEACKSGNTQVCSEVLAHAAGLALDAPGGYGEYVNYRSDMVRKLPKTMSFEEGAMIEPTAVAYHAIKTGEVKKGDKVLVVGGGIIGLMSATIAKLFGASYVALTETNPKRGQKSVDLGAADEWYNALDEKTIPTLMQKTNGGFDKVIECCGNAPAVGSAITLCKALGTIVLVGVSFAPIAIPTLPTLLREQTLKGVFAYTAKDFEISMDLIAKKKVDVLKFKDEEVGLKGVQKAFEKLTSGKDSVVKILIDPKK